jgi:hypothetical protein
MSNAIRHLTATTQRLASRAGQVIAECNEATRRLTTLACTPDRYPVDPDRAPDTYAEFVIRSAAVLPRGPERSTPPLSGADKC